MIRALKHLLGLAQREDATAAELSPSLPVAEAELAAAMDAQAAAEAAFNASLLAPDEIASNKLDVAQREAVVRVKRAAALIDALRQKLTDAQAREAEAGRVMRYEEARKQADDAAAALEEWYPKLASDMVALLGAVAQAEDLVRAANADRPEGTEAIISVERRVRSRIGTPEEIVHTGHVDLWVQVGQTRPGSINQDAVRATGGGRGMLPVPGHPQNEGREMELRRFREERFFPADHGAAPEGLAERLVLPGFRQGEADFFLPVERPYQGTITPADVLARIKMLRAQPRQAALQQAVETRLIPENTEPVRALPQPESHRQIRGLYPAEENAST